MATQVNSLDPWTQARNALAQDLTATLELLATEPFSADPQSDFQQARQQRNRILDQLQTLAVTGIKEIDATIAGGTLIQQIEGLAQQAEDEANRLKAAAKTVANIAGAVDKATAVVTKIASLPFL
jgi:CHASE3 domain sensor protein